MKENDREFEELLKKAVCSYHKEEMQALPSKEELEKNCRLSDEFYEKMDALVQRQRHPYRKNIMRYAAAAACFLLLTSGIVCMAAYVLVGAENFKAFFSRNAEKCNFSNSAVMNLEQLTDMAVTKTGTVYEDDDICLELKGLIKSGNMFSMILQGTLKQLDSITVPGGPGEAHCYSFLESDIDAEGDLSASSTYYYQEDDKNLAPNQFVYFTTYTAEEGFEGESYAFTFRDFGYYNDCFEVEVPKEETADLDESAAVSTSVSSSVSTGFYDDSGVAICSGTWTFTVNMDQARDISFGRDYNLTVNDGQGDVNIDYIVLSPIGCSVYMSTLYREEDNTDYFSSIKILLKNGSYLEESYYEMSLSESAIFDEGKEDETSTATRELTFEFKVPIDIRQVKAIEVFGKECEIQAPEK